jgi:two-component system sensor histidine kinase CpxA
MGRLFWRIFLSFGAAMVVILVVAVAVSFSLASQMMQDTGLEGRAAAVQRAAKILDQGGREALTRWLRNNPRITPQRELLIIDEQGRDLLGRSLPRRMRPLLRHGQPANGPPPPRNFRPSRFMPQLIAPDGSRYRLVTAPAGPNPFGVLGWPRARLAWLVTTILVAGLVSWLLARYITVPIGRLQAASRELAAGRLDTRMGRRFDTRRDEIGDLAQDFDRMAAQLEQLISQRETLLRDISHELRSPLTRLRMALALAQRQEHSATRDHLQRIEMEADRLESLIAQVLSLARINTGQQGINQRVDLSELVERVVADARYEQPDRQINWVGGTGCYVEGDDGALTSAIENVVRNALNHSPPGQAIELSLETTPDNQIRLRVADRGPGVPETDLERIFEPFFQVEPSRDHVSSGFGVGLAISARVLRRHGGSIAARNRDGGGLELCLTLPAAAAGSID